MSTHAQPLHVQDAWALPGGFVDENEPLDHAAGRELQEETGLDPKDLPSFFQVCLRQLVMHWCIVVHCSWTGTVLS